MLGLNNDHPPTSAPTTDQPAAHLVPRAGLTGAYVLGLPVSAICGIRFVPSRNADPLPLCAGCARRWGGGAQ